MIQLESLLTKDSGDAEIQVMLQLHICFSEKQVFLFSIGSDD